MGISVGVDLTGCNVVFFVPPLDNRIDDFSIKAIQELMNRGIGCVRTMTIKEASEQFAQTQQEYGAIPADQKFLRLTPKGKITQLFR